MHRGEAEGSKQVPCSRFVQRRTLRREWPEAGSSADSSEDSLSLLRKSLAVERFDFSVGGLCTVS